MEAKRNISGEWWLGQSDMLRLLGKSRTWLWRACNDIPSATRRQGRTTEYNAPAIITALLDAKEADDGELIANSGPPSPALERLRGARAAIAEIELSERRRDTIPREEWRGILMRCASYIRGAGDILRRRFGNDAVEILDGAIDRMEADITKELSA